MKQIKTGIDKLIELLKQEKKLSFERASFELGVSKKIISEWAEFLEDKGIVTIEYKFFKPYIIEKQTSKKELAKQKKHFEIQKETLVNRVETVLKGLEKDNLRLKKFKEGFEEIKNEVSNEIENVKNELEEMDKFEKMRAEVNKKLIEIKTKFKVVNEDLDKEMLKEIQKYEEVLKKFQHNKVKEKNVLEAKKRIENKIRNSYLEDKQKLLELVNESHRLLSEIRKIRENIIKKAHSIKETSGKKLKNEVIKKFELFFDRKNKINTELQRLEEEEQEMLHRIKDLNAKLAKIEFDKDRKNILQELADVEKKFDELVLKRKEIKNELTKLISLT